MHVPSGNRRQRSSGAFRRRPPQLLPILRTDHECYLAPTLLASLPLWPLHAYMLTYALHSPPVFTQPRSSVDPFMLPRRTGAQVQQVLADRRARGPLLAQGGEARRRRQARRDLAPVPEVGEWRGPGAGPSPLFLLAQTKMTDRSSLLSPSLSSVLVMSLGWMCRCT